MDFGELIKYLDSIRCLALGIMMPDSSSFQVELDYDAQSWLLIDKAASICVYTDEGDIILHKENGLWHPM